jgi:hypothetical protein
MLGLRIKWKLSDEEVSALLLFHASNRYHNFLLCQKLEDRLLPNAEIVLMRKQLNVTSFYK